MPRARSLKPGFFKNEELASLGFAAMLLYEGLWVLADREGRLEDRPKRIKAEIFPYSDVEVEGILTALSKAGFIIRYKVDGTGFIAIPTWKKHQNPHLKEAASTIPAPCEHGASTVQKQCSHHASTGNSGTSTGNSGTSPADSGLRTPDSLNLTPDSGNRTPETARDARDGVALASDKIAEEWIGVFLAAGVELSEADVMMAYRGTARVKGFLSYSEEEQREILRYTIGKARTTSAQYMGMPINLLGRQEWTRKGTGRLLPEPVRKSAADLAQERAAARFLAEG